MHVITGLSAIYHVRCSSLLRDYAEARHEVLGIG
jgi:hypothetical protein